MTLRDSLGLNKPKTPQENKTYQGKRPRSRIQKNEPAALGLFDSRDSTTNSGRLPDKSVFHVQYDAATKKWTGTLTIPGQFSCEETAGGVFRLLQILDRRFREVSALVR